MPPTRYPLHFTGVRTRCCRVAAHSSHFRLLINRPYPLRQQPQYSLFFNMPFSFLLCSEESVFVIKVLYNMLFYGLPLGMVPGSRYRESNLSSRARLPLPVAILRPVRALAQEFRVQEAMSQRLPLLQKLEYDLIYKRTRK